MTQHPRLLLILLVVAVIVSDVTAALGDQEESPAMGTPPELLAETESSSVPPPRGALRGGRFGTGAVRRTPKTPDTTTTMTPVLPLAHWSSGRNHGGGPDDMMISGAAGATAGAATTTGAVNATILHVMMDCNEGEDALLCKNRIQAMVRAHNPEALIRFLHYLELCHGWSAELKDTDPIVLSTMTGIHEDRPRETLHIRSSIELHGPILKENDGTDRSTGDTSRYRPIHPRNLQSGYYVINDGQYTPYGIKLVQAQEAWATHNTKGEGVRVCVMDTGVNREHPDLDDLFGYDGTDLVSPWWRDTDGHGTHVTGTIAANDNQQGVVGVAPNADIFTARVFSTNGMFYSSNIIIALQVCKDGGAQVISMSLGGPNAVSYEAKAYQDLYDKFNIVTVAASGNTGGYDLLYPAAYANVISVGSVNPQGTARSSFSTRNSQVQITAPGEQILSTWENGQYATVSGTSMACPHISGVVALMLSKNPTATPAQITTALTSSATKVGEGTTPNSSTGYGLVNAVAAVAAITQYDTPATNTSGGTTNTVENSNTSKEDTCIDVVITVRTDRYGSDTSHWLQSGTAYLFYETDLDSFASYREQVCVDPQVCTTYNIRDTFGDGISGEGVEIKVNGVVEYSGGNFGAAGIKTIGTC